jgi:hypothetical protein
VKKQLALTAAIVATAISASAAHAVGVPAGPSGGLVTQPPREQTVPSGPPGGFAARIRAEAAAAAADARPDQFDFADAAIGLGVGLGAALLIARGARTRRSEPVDA